MMKNNTIHLFFAIVFALGVQAQNVNSVQQLTGNANTNLGSAVDVFGMTMVVGANEAGATDSGEAGIFTLNTTEQQWEFATLLTPQTTRQDGLYGSAVAISADQIFVGEAPDNPELQGIVHIYDHSGEFVQTLTDGVINSRFGKAIAVQDNTLVIGSPGAKTVGSGPLGKVFVYEKGVDNTWTLVQSLSPSRTLNNPDAFGFSVAIENNTLVIGAPEGFDGTGVGGTGVAYIFEKENDTWQQKKLLSYRDRGFNATPTFADKFGTDVAIDQNTALIGIPRDDIDGTDTGSVYVYEKSVTGNWEYDNRINALNPANNKFFGGTVALENDIAIVGTPEAGIGNSNARLFTKTTNGWVSTRSFGNGLGKYGLSVVLKDDQLIITQPGLVDIYAVDRGVLSVAQQQFSEDVIVAPNPATAMDTIKIFSDKNITIKSVQLYAPNGRLVRSFDDPLQMNVSLLDAGIYMMSIQDSQNKVAIKKLLIH